MSQAGLYPARDAGAGVTAPAGAFRGLMRDGVVVFRGIRYAEPPVGPLRFAPPVPAKRREEPCDALAAGPISIQDIDPLPLVLPGAENCYYSPNPLVSEDCLNLNIWSPGLADRAAVLVWIHGGAFLCGSGGGPWLDGTRQARENGIVVVTLNYRLGYLGGLYLGDYDARRSNLALQDRSSRCAGCATISPRSAATRTELRSAASRPERCRRRPCSPPPKRAGYSGGRSSRADTSTRSSTSTTARADDRGDPRSPPRRRRRRCAG